MRFERRGQAAGPCLGLCIPLREAGAFGRQDAKRAGVQRAPPNGAPSEPQPPLVDDASPSLLRSLRFAAGSSPGLHDDERTSASSKSGGAPAAAVRGDARLRLTPVASACARSATRSSGCSMPIETRIVASETPRRSRVSFGHAGMGGGGRVAGQRFGAAEADGELEDLQRVEDAEGLRLAALDVEGEGRAGRRRIARRRPAAPASLPAGRRGGGPWRRCGCSRRNSRHDLAHCGSPRSCAAPAFRASARASSRNADRAACRSPSAAAGPACMAPWCRAPRRRSGRNGRRHISSASRPRCRRRAASGFWKSGPSRVLSQTIDRPVALRRRRSRRRCGAPARCRPAC